MNSLTLRTGRYAVIVEADLKGFFDPIDHDLMLNLLRQRIDDKPLLNLIRRWLKAGILETDGRVIHTARRHYFADTGQTGTVRWLLPGQGQRRNVPAIPRARVQMLREALFLRGAGPCRCHSSLLSVWHL